MSWAIIVTLPDGEPAFLAEEDTPLLYDTEAEALANCIEFRSSNDDERRAKVVELP